MRRRRFLEILEIAVASTISLGASAAEASIEKKAIAFDGFVIFDPKSVAALAENLFPGKGPDLMNACVSGNSNIAGCAIRWGAMQISGRSRAKHCISQPD
jgi:hypothetical protein